MDENTYSNIPDGIVSISEELLDCYASKLIGVTIPDSVAKIYINENGITSAYFDPPEIQFTYRGNTYDWYRQRDELFQAINGDGHIKGTARSAGMVLLP